MKLETETIGHDVRGHRVSQQTPGLRKVPAYDLPYFPRPAGVLGKGAPRPAGAAGLERL